MRFKHLYLIIPLLALALLGYRAETPNTHFEERVKIALRDTGNQLLLANTDSTSLVLPVMPLGDSRYELAFGTSIHIAPETLAPLINQSLQKAELPMNYIAEVIDCSTQDVVYSYQYSQNVTEQMIPCMGRELPKGCYKVIILFTETPDRVVAYTNYPLYSLILVGFIGVGFVYQTTTKKQKPAAINDHLYTVLGAFKFYNEQHQLVLDHKVIPLTTKECELIQLFSRNQNTIVKRDYLIKTIWEDQGVFVGRSLDTYISKIRKKLALDSRISLINIHGVGYKLEVSVD